MPSASKGSVPSKPAKKKWTPATLAQTTRANAGAIAIAFVKPPPDGCRSEDAANYVRGTEGLDLLYAHRPLARQLLERATERDTPMGRLRVISVEGLIGFKLQGYVNDATRTRDLDDIRALVRQHRATLNTQELQSYFALFHQLDLFHALLD